MGEHLTADYTERFPLEAFLRERKKDGGLWYETPIWVQQGGWPEEDGDWIRAPWLDEIHTTTVRIG